MKGKGAANCRLRETTSVVRFLGRKVADQQPKDDCRSGLDTRALLPGGLSSHCSLARLQSWRRPSTMDDRRWTIDDPTHHLCTCDAGATPAGVRVHFTTSTKSS